MTEGGIVGACVILALCFLVGAPGNLLVIWTILRHMKQRSNTVVLILHLAAADLLVLVTLPLWIYSLAQSWVFGEAACKGIAVLIYTSMYCSVFLITLMSLERFLSVRYPVAHLHWKNKNMLNKILLVVWCLAFLFSIPSIPTRVLDEKDGCVYRELSSASLEVACRLLEILVGFVLPFCVLVVCYGCLMSRIRQMTFRTKQKSTSLITAVVIVFFLCWFPHQLANVLFLLSLNADQTGPDTAGNLKAATESIGFIAGAMVFISSAVNPLLYAFAARKIKSSLRAPRIRRLFHHLSHVTTEEEGTELSVVSRQKSSRIESDKLSTNVMLSVGVDVKARDDVSS